MTSAIESRPVLPLILVFVFFAFPASNAAANIAMLLTCVLWLFSNDWENRRTIITHNTGVLFALALYGWILIGAIYSHGSDKDILNALIKYFKVAFIAIVVTSLYQKEWRNRAWQAYTAILFITLISTYLNIWLDIPWSTARSPDIDQTIFKDYISQGLMMSMFVLICLFNWQKPDQTTQFKIIWIISALMGIFSITHLSIGRTGYLSLSFAIIAYFLWSQKGIQKWVPIFALLVVGLFSYKTSDNIKSRVDLAIEEVKTHNIENYSSIGQRLYYTQKSLELIGKNPLIGTGTGSYGSEFCKIADTETWCKLGKHHPHNQFLLIWVENGLVGFLLFVGLIISPVWMTRHSPLPERGLAAGFSAIFVVGSLTHGSLWLSTESHFHTLIAALIFAKHSPQKKQCTQNMTISD